MLVACIPILRNPGVSWNLSNHPIGFPDCRIWQSKQMPRHFIHCFCFERDCGWALGLVFTQALKKMFTRCSGLHCKLPLASANKPPIWQFMVQGSWIIKATFLPYIGILHLVRVPHQYTAIQQHIVTKIPDLGDQWVFVWAQGTSIHCQLSHWEKKTTVVGPTRAR